MTDKKENIADTQSDALLEEAALHWQQISAPEASHLEFEALTQWLEQSPLHQDAFEKIEQTVLTVEEFAETNHKTNNSRNTAAQPIPFRPKVQEQNSHHTAPSKWSAWRPALLAAGLALAVFGFWSLTTSAPKPSEQTQYMAQTNAQSIDLADGSMITLNRNTQLDVDFRTDQRSVKMSDGEAIFSVSPDADRPFIVETNHATVLVVGTKFNVLASTPYTEVTVSEGIVEVEINGHTQRLTIGEQLRLNPDNSFSVMKTDPNRSMAWTGGELIYDSTPLERVIFDLGRYFDKEFVVDENLEQIRFSGILLTNDLNAILGLLDASLDITIHQDDRKVAFTQP